MKEFKVFLRFLFSFSPRRFVINCTMMLLSTFISGIGLFLLIPLLKFTGWIGGHHSNDLFTYISNQVFGPAIYHFPLLLILGLFVAVITSVTVLEFIQSRYMTRFGQDFMLSLQRKLNHCVAHASWAFLVQRNLKHAHYMITSGISQVNMLTTYSLQMITDGLLVSVFLIASFIFSFQLTLITFLIALASFAVMHRHKARLIGRKSFTQTQNAQVELAHFLEGMKLAKSYNRVDAFIYRFEAMQRANYDFQLEFAKSQFMIRGLFKVSTAFIFSLLFWLSFSWLHIPLPTLLALLLLFSRLLPRISSLQQTYLRVANILPIFEQVQTMTQEFETHQEVMNPAARLSWSRHITLSDISYTYEHKQALKELSFQFKHNTSTAIVGPSGAGKTTLADILLGLLIPQSGSVLIDDVELTGEQLYAWRNQVSYVPQEVHLFNGSITDNLLWATPQVSEDDLWTALSMAAAEGFVRSLPQGIDTIVGDRGIKLSGGERQRLALARALLRHPSVLILDEATSALDTQNEDLIYQTLKNLHGKLTIIIISHRFSTIQNADQVLVLDQGQLQESGSPTQLLAEPSSLFYHLFNQNH